MPVYALDMMGRQAPTEDVKVVLEQTFGDEGMFFSLAF